MDFFIVNINLWNNRAVVQINYDTVAEVVNGNTLNYELGNFSAAARVF